MGKEWINWSGSLRFRPQFIESPHNEEEVQHIISEAILTGKSVRIVGSGHSSMPLVATDQILVKQDGLIGLVDHDMSHLQVKMLPGTTIEMAGDALIKLRLDIHNTGDVDFQSLGGAFGTGTHGSGRKLPNLSAMLIGCRLVDGKGEVKAYHQDQDPEMLNALRVSMGALGFFTELTIQAEKANKYSRREYCTHVDTALEHLDELIHENEMFDFYWYPRTDQVKLRICNEIGKGMQEVSFAEEMKVNEGWLYEILPQFRDNKYEEMEYIIPIEAGPECFKEVRKRIKEKHRHYVGWRVLYRTIAADDAYLSPFYKRDGVSIALLQNSNLEYKKYFDDMEPVFKAYDGRPHWGKKHTMEATELGRLYPEWEKFREIRKKMDPDGVFLNDYLKKIFGE